MVKAKRHLAIIRAKRYNLKQIPTIVSKQFDYTRMNGKDILAFWLSFLDVIEKATLTILNKYQIAGDIIEKFFMYAKKLVKSAKKINWLSLLIEYVNVLDLVIKRNPNIINYENVLNEVLHNTNKLIGEYLRLWYGFFDLSYFDISIFIE